MITEIKDIKKLQKLLKSSMDECSYLKECCRKAGIELAKHSFEWDSKEKNLVVQAMQLNKKYEGLKQTLEEIKEILGDKIKLRTKGLEVEIHPEHIFLIEIYNKINEVLK